MPAGGLNKRQRDYYALIGVARTADIIEIRQAYLTLIKRFHPDLQALGAARDQASNFVAALNVAYATLRDAPRRARYDAELDRSRAADLRKAHDRVWARRSGSQSRSQPLAALLPGRRHSQHAEPTEFRRFVLSFAATSAVIVFLMLILKGVSSDAAMTPYGPATTVVSLPSPAVDLKSLRPLAARAVREAMDLPLDRAGTYSRRCFAAASSRGELKASLECVMFDDAVLLLNGQLDGSIQPYFRLNWCRARHLDALSPFGFDSDDRLNQIQALTADEVMLAIPHEDRERVDVND